MMASHFTEFAFGIKDITKEEEFWLVERARSLPENISTDLWKRGRVFHIYSLESAADLEEAADLAHVFLKRFRPKSVIGFEFSMRCSRPRPGEFGGGAVYITNSHIAYMSTADWLQEQISGERDV